MVVSLGMDYWLWMIIESRRVAGSHQQGSKRYNQSQAQNKNAEVLHFFLLCLD
jgi:hypothetical protein